MSQAPLFVCTSDWHLEHLFRSQDPRCEGWSEAVFRANITDICKTALNYDGPVAMLGAGDEVEASEINGSGKAALDWGKAQLKENKITFFYIDGNHDRQARSRPSLLADWGTRRTTTPVEWNGMKLAGIDGTTSAQLEVQLQVLADNGGCDVLLLHQASKHLFGFESSGSFDVLSIPATVCRKLILVGDIHVQDVTSTAMGDGTTRHVVSPGSWVPRNVAEGGRQGYALWTPGSVPQLVSANRIAITDVELPEDITQAAEQASTAVRAPVPGMYEVLHLHAVRDQLAMVRKVAADPAVPANRLVLVSPLTSELLEEEARAKEILSGPVKVGSMRDKLRFLVHPQKDKALFDLAAAMLDAPSKDHVQVMLSSFIKDALAGKVPLDAVPVVEPEPVAPVEVAPVATNNERMLSL